MNANHLLALLLLSGATPLRASDPICLKDYLLLRPGKAKPLSKVVAQLESATDQTRHQLDLAVKQASLSEQERRVMEKVLEGKDLPQVASELGIGLKTAQSHYQRAVLSLAQFRASQVTAQPVPEDAEAVDWLRQELSARNMVLEDLGAKAGIDLNRFLALEQVLAGHPTGSAMEREALRSARDAFNNTPDKTRETPPTRLPGEELGAWIERENKLRNWDTRTLVLALASKQAEADALGTLMSSTEAAAKVTIHTRVSLVKRLESLYAQNSPQNAELHLPRPGENANDWFARQLTARYADSVPTAPPSDLLRKLGSHDQRRVRAAFNARAFSQPPSNTIIRALGEYFRSK
jgi:hypothetical protein